MTKVTGLEDFQKKINAFADKIESLKGQHNVKTSELFTEKFVQHHTKFTSFEEMLDAGGFHFNTQEEFDNLPTENLDVFTREISSFKSWKDFVQAAVVEWAKKKIRI